jgi:hypothetical protein
MKTILHLFTSKEKIYRKYVATEQLLINFERIFVYIRLHTKSAYRVVSNKTRSGIHERTISLRFLSVILRVLRFEVSGWIS